MSKNYAPRSSYGGVPQGVQYIREWGAPPMPNKKAI
jgi:hypothetical protein